MMKPHPFFKRLTLKQAKTLAAADQAPRLTGLEDEYKNALPDRNFECYELKDGRVIIIERQRKVRPWVCVHESIEALRELQSIWKAEAEYLKQHPGGVDILHQFFRESDIGEEGSERIRQEVADLIAVDVLKLNYSLNSLKLLDKYAAHIGLRYFDGDKPEHARIFGLLLLYVGSVIVNLFGASWSWHKRGEVLAPRIDADWDVLCDFADFFVDYTINYGQNPQFYKRVKESWTYYNLSRSKNK
ncbi:MAG: hypothetical protein JSS72_04100 [Armatimonadetes bacterium]|nr:hypothetical protein [Armatimonadota bacterium]